MSDAHCKDLWIGALSAGLLTGASRQACYRLADSGEVTVRHAENNRLEFLVRDLVKRNPLSLTGEMCDLLVQADTGDAAAMRELGLCLLSEGQQSSAFRWLLQAAEKKDMDAMDWVSTCYLEGIGTEIDVALAMRWLGDAAAAGHPIAQAKIAAL